MPFDLCRNGSCNISGWCKRMTYPVTPDMDPERIFFRCTPENNYKYYVRNKAREIYERDHPEEAFNFKNDKSKQEEYNHHSGESGVREDDEISDSTSEFISSWCSVEQDRILQLQRSSDRGSDLPISAISDYFEELCRALARQCASQGHVVLPNVTLDGISIARSGDGQLDD